MTLDSRPRSTEAVTRACYARGLPAPSWLSLVRDAAQAEGLAQEKLEEAITHSLLSLLADSPFTPPLIAQYTHTALQDATLARPGQVARAIVSQATTLALPTAELVFSAINQSLASAPSQPSYICETPTETARAVKQVLDSLLPLIVASPTSALETTRYLSYFLSHLPHRLTKGTTDAALLESCAKRVQAAADEVAKVRPKDATVLATLQQNLEALRGKMTPRGRRRVPSKVDLDEADETEGLRTPFGDAALLVSRILSNPFLPSQQLHSSFLALIRYRIAQSAFRRSTPQKALVLVLSEVFGGVIRAVQEAKRADVTQESVLFAKLPSTLKDLTTVSGLERLPEALADALRLVQGWLSRTKSIYGTDNGSSFGVFNQFVVACCQHDLLIADVGASLAREVDVSELQPVMMEDYQSRLATSSIDDFKQVLDDAIHSFSAQRNVASAVASLFAAKVQSADLAGLASLCDALVENRDAMLIIFVHIEPRELLRQVRQALDSFDATQENSDDVNPVERYGSLVLFIQLVVSRCKLLGNLAYHLDSSSSFLVSWLPSASAVYAISTMTEDERQAVSGWIGALFGEGISDDLMHATNPRTLLRVAPTILKQSLKARQAGIVDMDSLRDALSYFLQELLRFTLPGVLKWLIAEIERTPPSPQQTSMLDLLQVLVFSDALPSAVLELVALDLARLLISPAFAPNPPSVIDLARLRRTIAPYRPPSATAETATRDGHEAFSAAVRPTLSPTEGGDDTAAAVPQLDDALRLCLRASGTPDSFFSSAFLPHIVESLATPPSLKPQSVDPAHYSRLERYAAAVLAAPDAMNGRPLVVAFVWATLPYIEEWNQPSTDSRYAAETAQVYVEMIADAIAGAVVLVKGEAEPNGPSTAMQQTDAAMEELARRIEVVRRSRKTGDADVQEEEERTTMLDALVDRLLSWPPFVEAYPKLAALGTA